MRGDHWTVVARSILVRSGSSVASEALAERLSFGAVLLEMDMVGERLQFKKLQGEGPESGWVTIKVKEKVLVQRAIDALVLPENVLRLWALSDIHTDKKENMQWIRELDENAFQEDVLILAGDIANTMEVLEETLLLLKARFQRIFFCPGSLADWWNTCPVMVWPWGGRRLLKLKPQTDEVGDFGLQLRRQIPCNYGGLQIVRRCALDETTPGILNTGAGRLVVVPILAWHHPQWDTEPELQEWQVPALEKTMADYWATRWPQKLRIEDGSVAEAFDQLNERCFQNVMQRRDEFQAVVSFSHFVPRIELNPEKRYLIPSSLAKAVGSAYLKERVEKLKPDVHVFGHTHFGYDMELDGIRYLQAPLATPAERVWAGSLVTLGGFPIERKPCLVWTSDLGFASTYRSSWSKYYQRYGRQPAVTDVIPSLCCNLYTPSSASRTGWIAGRMPIWLFGPLPSRIQEAEMVINEVRNITGRAAVLQRSAKGREKLPPSSQGDPKMLRGEEALGLHAAGAHVFIDVRPPGAAGGCIPGAISLPHPAATETLASLDDDVLLQLCERLNAKSGNMIIYAEEDESSWDAALLLAGYFRIWPTA
ncbi:unnamed protein product, partial [Durusdinium trenchii]